MRDARPFLRLSAFVGLMAFSLAALAAPSADLWKYWNEAGTKTGIDHSDWDAFLSSYVVVGKDGINRVSYGKVSKADTAKLTAYVRKLARTSIRKYTREEQRAYWINLYNAATVKVVLDAYPVDSIMKISLGGGLFSKGPWKKELLAIEEQKVSLDDIEHRILRPIWKDPRTHYAVNCASLSCPNLQPKAYTPANMEQLLDAGARAYVNHPRAVSFDAKGRLVVSSIYVWFQSDFGGDDAGVIKHLTQYAEPALAKKLAGVEKIGSDAYDWTLNDAK